MDQGKNLHELFLSTNLSLVHSAVYTTLTC